MARTAKAPAAHSPRPGIARRAEPPVTWMSVAGRACSTAKRAAVERKVNAARPGAAAQSSNAVGAASASGPPPNGPLRVPP